MAYVSARDLNDLLVHCIETEDIPYAVVAGISDNARKRFDLVHTRRILGYTPRDDGFKVLGIEVLVAGHVDVATLEGKDLPFLGDEAVSPDAAVVDPEQVE